MPRVFVPDASVLLKWVLPPNDESDGDRALELKTAWMDDLCELVVPQLWVFEVGNVVGLKQPAIAVALLQGLIDLGLRDEPAPRYFEGILKLMREYKVTIYDAAYHALAIHHRGTMLTADRAYVKKTRKAGHVELLSEWHGVAS